MTVDRKATKARINRAPGKLLETLQSDPLLAEQLASVSSHQTLYLVNSEKVASSIGLESSAHEIALTLDRTELESGSGETERVLGDSASVYPGIGQWLPVRKLIAPGDPIDPTAEYRLVGVLGRGGTGVVYQAHQRAVDREVAVKVLRDELTNDVVARQQFLGEAMTIGGLDHPNVIAIHEVGMDDRGRLFYSMKRVDGTAWSAVIDQRSTNDNLQVLLRVADAIAYAHSRGLVHRDIKPENVMLGPFGEVLVADWGLAVPHPLPLFENDSLVSVGGTPAYMAPELAMGELDQVGPHTDVYLLGAVLYRILAGFPPHFGSSVLECLQAAADNLIRTTDAQGELMDIARRAMASDPLDRYVDVSEFQTAIQNYLQHQESVGLTDRARKLLRRADLAPGYDTFGLALTLIQEALELWPENRRAERMLRDTRMAFARRATDQGDLDLAMSLVQAAEAEDSELARRIQQLQESRCQQNADANRFAQLFAHSPDAVLLTRLEDGVVLDANDLFFNLVGYERDQVVGKSVVDLRLWESPENRERFVAEVLKNGRVDSIEIHFTHPDGRKVWVLLTARLLELEDQQLVVAHVRDNSARKLAEYQLQRSRIRLHEIQELAKLGTWEIDLLDGRMVWGQESFRMLGVVRAPESIEEFLDLVHPNERESVAKAIDEAIRHGAAFHLDIRLRRANGTNNRVVMRAQPILEGGQTVELFGIFLDVADRPFD